LTIATKIVPALTRTTLSAILTARGVLPEQLTAIPVLSQRVSALAHLSSPDLGLPACVFRYQFVPFFGFSSPERIILVFKRHALAAESRHGTAMFKDIHSTLPHAD
jgi:hypothetical protein